MRPSSSRKTMSVKVPPMSTPTRIALPPSPSPALLHRVGAGLGDLAILLRGGPGHADGPHDLALQHDGQSPFEGSRVLEPQDPQIGPPGGHEVLERLRRPSEGHRRVRLLASDLDATDLRVVHPLHHDRISPRVEDD